jgi:tRNA A-37 threonylcarbamoyl transferase component Bud32
VLVGAEAHAVSLRDRGSTGFAVPQAFADSRTMDTEVDGLPTVLDADTRAATTARDAIPPRPADAERYKPDGELGRGGMGIVSAQIDTRIGRRIACKELRPDAAGNAELRARFLREARVQGQLEHPAIVPVYDIGERADGTTYFTMKTIRGITLADIITGRVRGDDDAAKRYPRRHLLAAFERICRAVDYAHGQGVVHRDLKPANLILGEYGEVYVLDWGLAKELAAVGRASTESTGEHVERRTSGGSHDMTSADALLGTPGYMAPEQIVDARGVGPGADVYALGAILFELVTLEPLHPRGLAAIESTRDGVAERLATRTATAGSVPELDRAIAVATAFAPDARGTARALADAVERYLEGEHDLALRRAKAAEHLDAATDVAVTGARRDAIQHVAKAIALEPGNAAALTALADMLRVVPSPRPPELVAEIGARRAGELNGMARIGGMLYAAFSLFLAILLWMGVRQPAVLAAMFVPMAAAAVLSFAATRTSEAKSWLIVGAMVASTFALAMGTRILSPLVLIPGALATNTMGFAVFVDRRTRAIVTVVALAAFVIPLALELGDVTPETFAIDGRIVILPTAVDLPRLPTLVLVAAASLSSILMASVLVGYFRDRLTDAEERLLAQNWQLGSLVPTELATVTSVSATA